MAWRFTGTRTCGEVLVRKDKPMAPVISDFPDEPTAPDGSLPVHEKIASALDSVTQIMGDVYNGLSKEFRDTSAQQQVELRSFRAHVDGCFESIQQQLDRLEGRDADELCHQLSNELCHQLLKALPPAIKVVNADIVLDAVRAPVVEGVPGNNTCSVVAPAPNAQFITDIDTVAEGAERCKPVTPSDVVLQPTGQQYQVLIDDVLVAQEAQLAQMAAKPYDPGALKFTQVAQQQQQLQDSYGSGVLGHEQTPAGSGTGGTEVDAGRDQLLFELRKQHGEVMQLIRYQFAERPGQDSQLGDPLLAADGDEGSDCCEPGVATVEDGCTLLKETSAEQLKEVDYDEDEDGWQPSHIVLKEDASLSSVFGNDDDLGKAPYSVEDLYWETGLCQCIARSLLFEHITVFVVMLNAIFIGVDSDYNYAQNIYDADLFFQACSQFFCVYFTWELLVRLCAFKHKCSCFRDGWFKFDSFLVSTMILDIWVLMPILHFVGGNVSIPTQPLRLLRLFKLTRMARLAKAFPELVTMIKGLVRSLRAVSSSGILVMLMVYVWGIMMHMLMKDETEFNERLWRESFLSFDTMTKCIWTLLMDGTLMLDNAAPLMTEMLFADDMVYKLAGSLFVIYTLLSALLILQMLIGVLTDVVSQVSQEQKDATAIGLVKQELLADLRVHDGGDGKISQEELYEVMHDPKSKALMLKLKINQPFLLELQKLMFKRPGMKVPLINVLDMLIMCRGDQVATVESIANALLSIIQEIQEMNKTVKQDLYTDVQSVKVTLEKDIMDIKTLLGRHRMLGN